MGPHLFDKHNSRNGVRTDPKQIFENRAHLTTHCIATKNTITNTWFEKTNKNY